jgi:hypothetical protein
LLIREGTGVRKAQSLRAVFTLNCIRKFFHIPVVPKALPVGGWPLALPYLGPAGTAPTFIDSQVVHQPPITTIIWKYVPKKIHTLLLKISQCY